MAEMTDWQKVVRLLNNLIALDYDAIEAYASALKRLSDAGDRAEVEGFMADHRRHVTDLTQLVLSIGDTPVTSADFKKVLAKGKVVIASIAGERGVLEAMRSNEETTSRVYQRASVELGVPQRVREVIASNLADEWRHLSWIVSRIGAAKNHSRAVSAHR
jgi:rubrerythrin